MAPSPESTLQYDSKLAHALEGPQVTVHDTKQSAEALQIALIQRGGMFVLMFMLLSNAAAHKIQMHNIALM